MGVMATVARGLFLRGGLETLGEIRDAVRPNATRQLELGHEAFVAAQSTLAAEFGTSRTGRFDRFVNGLNRLPRPVLALGTLGLFVFAMIDPDGFATRMQALAQVPEPLWWLLGAVVAFYFGARETHYMRGTRPVIAPPVTSLPAPMGPEPSDTGNAALRDWLARAEREAG